MPNFQFLYKRKSFYKQPKIRITFCEGHKKVPKCEVLRKDISK